MTHLLITSARSQSLSALLPSIHSEKVPSLKNKKMPLVYTYQQVRLENTVKYLQLDPLFRLL